MALFNIKTNQPVSIPKNKPLSDHMKRSVTERLIPETHKGHHFFRLEERARILN